MVSKPLLPPSNMYTGVVAHIYAANNTAGLLGQLREKLVDLFNTKCMCIFLNFNKSVRFHPIILCLFFHDRVVSVEIKV